MTLKQAVHTLALKQPPLRTHLIPLLRGASTTKKASWDRALLRAAGDALSEAHQGPAFPKPGTEAKVLDSLAEVMQAALADAVPGAALTNEQAQGTQAQDDSFLGKPNMAGVREAVYASIEAPEALVFDLEVDVARRTLAHAWEAPLHRMGYTFQPKALEDILAYRSTLWLKVWQAAVDAFIDEVDYEFRAQDMANGNDSLTSNYVERVTSAESAESADYDDDWTGGATMAPNGAVSILAASTRSGGFQAKFRVMADVEISINVP